MHDDSIDILELISTSTRLKRVSKAVGNRGPEYAGPCPFCGGEDRLRVQPGKGQWWCRQCSPNEHWQSAADWVMRRDNVDYPEALRRLGVDRPPQRQEPSHWDYHDANGTVLYRVVRYSKNGKKQYAQQHPGPGNTWTPGLNGQTPTIYRLPEVLAAAQAGQTIYIAEGERCADALRSLGLVATTNSGGAGKWRHEFGQHLAGAGDVVIFADNDEPGRKHAEQVFASVRPVVPSARIVTFDELPPAGDVADWLAAGHSRDDLLTQCEPPAGTQTLVVETPAAAQEAEPKRMPVPITAADLAKKEIPPPRFFIDGMLRSGMALFIGNPGIGKTPALVQLALALAHGGRWLGHIQVPKCRVVYIGVEYDEGYIKDLLLQSAGTHDLPPDLFILTMENFTPPTTEQESIELLEYLITAYQADVIVIDVFSAYLPREKFKMDKYRGDYSEFMAYQRTAMLHRALIVGAWHGGKRDKDPETAYNGGQGMWGSAGGGRLTMYYDQDQTVRLRSQLRGFGRKEWTLEQAHISGAHFWSVVEADPEPIFASDAQARIYRLVKRSSDPLGAQAIQAMLKADNPESAPPLPYIRQLLSRMTERGIMKRLETGGYIMNDTKTNVDHGGSPGSHWIANQDTGSPGSHWIANQDTGSLNDHGGVSDPAKGLAIQQGGSLINSTAMPQNEPPGVSDPAIHEKCKSDPGDDWIVDYASVPPEELPYEQWPKPVPPEDIVVTHNPGAKRPWQVVIISTGRRMAYFRTKDEALREARGIRART